MEKTPIAKVRLLSTTKETDREYDYLCPGTAYVKRGNVVKIPFGKGDRIRFGIVITVTEETPSRPLKAILEVLPENVGLTEEALSLCERLQTQLFCTFGEVAKAILPAPVYQGKAKEIRLVSLAEGVVPQEALLPFRGKNKEAYLELLNYLSLTGEAEDKRLKELFPAGANALSFLEKKGWIRFRKAREMRTPLFLEEEGEKELPPLSPAQEKAFETLKALFEKRPCCALLHGVTGSGKTRVMLALCDYVLSLKKSVIFLVPEIALTGQTARMLVSRYGDKVSLLHSALSEGERRDSYIAIREGKKPVVLGTRSAVFAPLENIGLIVMDEEQDQSYKSDTALKFHARDVARFRCAKSGGMLLLASATPDIESYYKAKEGAWSLVTLSERFGSATLPRVEVIDLRPDLRKNPGILLGTKLREEISRNLKDGEQTILLMNRRGYRRFVSCIDCGEVIRCPNCSVSMTLHKGKFSRLSCHYCGYAAPLPEQCPSCHSEKLIPHGFGIQQLEEELHLLFPEARVVRLDSDSTASKNAHEEILGSFRQGEADILIGTQMVAKGHNFPNVTLVGIVMADSSLYLSDYRAAEHTFSLLTQVIGRAGRAEKKGRALIQTLNPRHDVFSLAADQDYESFYEGEIALRREFLFPPFCQLAVFTLAHEKEEEVISSAKRLSQILEQAFRGEFSDVKWIVYGPFDAPVYRLKNIYRKRFIIKFKNNPRSRALFEHLLQSFALKGKDGAKISLDIAPGLI